MQEFVSELELVAAFCGQLGRPPTPWGRVKYATEFGYQSGRTDILALDDSGRLIAFEAKTSDWRTALQQAYRNTSFAELSYVILPPLAAERSTIVPFEFKKRSIGLCTVGSDGIEILIEARYVEPVQPWLTDRAMLSLSAAR